MTLVLICEIETLIPTFQDIFEGYIVWYLSHTLVRVSTQLLIPILHLLAQARAPYKLNCIALIYDSLRVRLQIIESTLASS